jgi:hypothetical protein
VQSSLSGASDFIFEALSNNRDWIDIRIERDSIHISYIMEYISPEGLRLDGRRPLEM